MKCHNSRVRFDDNHWIKKEVYRKQTRLWNDPKKIPEIAHSNNGVHKYLVTILRPDLEIALSRFIFYFFFKSYKSFYS